MFICVIVTRGIHIIRNNTYSRTVDDNFHGQKYESRPCKYEVQKNFFVYDLVLIIQVLLAL